MGYAIRPSHGTPAPDEIAAVQDLLARAGLARTCQILALGRHTVQRLRGGLPVHRGTLTQLRLALRLAAKQEPQP